MKYEAVRLEALDFHDETFLISPPVDYISIQKYNLGLGVINPPSLRRNGDKYQIVCGWRRIKACQRLGYDEIPSIVYEMDELSDEGCLKFVLYENQRRLNEIDKAELLLKFKRLCDLNDNELIQKVLPLFGIGATRKNLERYMSLTGLESEITEACYTEKISPEQVLSLSEVDRNERLQIIRRILKRYKFSGSGLKGQTVHWYHNRSYLI
jgi:ParB family chromosome partitioning protein